MATELLDVELGEDGRRHRLEAKGSASERRVHGGDLESSILLATARGRRLGSSRGRADLLGYVPCCGVIPGTGRRVRDLVLERGLLEPEQLDRILSPEELAHPRLRDNV